MNAKTKNLLHIILMVPLFGGIACLLLGGIVWTLSGNELWNLMKKQTEICEGPNEADPTCFFLENSRGEFGRNKIKREKIHGKYYTFENLSGDNIFVSAKTEAEFYSFVCAAAQGNKFAHIDCTKIAGNQFQFANGRCEREPTESALAKGKCVDGIENNPTMNRLNGEEIGYYLNPIPVLFTTCNHWSSGFDYCFPLEF